MDAFNLHLENLPRTIALSTDGEAVLRYIDQRVLPQSLVIAQATHWEEVVDAIDTLSVRGAPALGIAGVGALTLWAQDAQRRALDGKAYEEELSQVAEAIASVRPTAVNLRWGIERALNEVGGLAATEGAAAVTQALSQLTCRLIEEDEAANRAIGRNGAALLEPGSRILTHCNAGSLATAFYGTALGIIYSAAAQGKIERVYADETRPVGQGARLTAWELTQAGVPVTLLCDNMAASLMAQGQVDAVIVGADRIAANGDTANKIGTYGLAVLAQYHSIPFYVAAPSSTVDATLKDGSAIVIEQRPPSEVAPDPLPGMDVWNPAFDVTPTQLISAIITQNGVFSPSAIGASL